MNPKNKNSKTVKANNSLEVIKDIGHATAQQMRDEVAKMPGQLMEQLFGITPGKSYSGEISPGGVVEFSDILSGEQAEISKEKQQIGLERIILEEERELVEQKTNELRMQLKVLQDEILKLADRTENMAEETVVAAMQAPVEPGVYHVIFFERLMEFIQSFRKKLEDASVWLHAVNKRAAKKNAWGSAYKKHGAKYLLSGEHYIARSAG